MTDAVLYLRRQLGERLLVPFRHKERVISKPTFATLLCRHPAADYSVHLLFLAAAYQRHHRSELCTTIRLIGQLTQRLLSVGSVRRHLRQVYTRLALSPAGGEHTRLAVQRIYLQTRVICKHTIYLMADG